MALKPLIATTTTLKTSVSNTLSFARYHLNYGIDHIYLFFDNPDDEAIPYLKQNARISCYRCTREYWAKLGIGANAKVQIKQKANATFALRLARRAKMDWIIHLDSDELLYGKKNIHNLFSPIAEQTEVLRFPVLEALPQKPGYENPLQDISLFKVYLGLKSNYQSFSMSAEDQKKQFRRARFWYRRKKLFYLMSNGYREKVIASFLLGHQMGKAAVRTSARVQYLENHLPIPEKDYKPMIAVSQKGFILHYDCRGYKHWKEKWSSRINGSANFQTEKFSKHRKKQIQLFREASLQKEEALIDLYKKLYHLSRYEKMLLYATDLVKRIKLDKRLFKPPVNSKSYKL